MNDEVVPIRPRKSEPLKVGDRIFKSAYDWTLTEKDLEKAARELVETEEKKKECLRKLKEKLSSESNAKYRQDDSYLLRFLRVRKYDVKKAYQNVKQFYEERRKHTEFFTLPSDLKSVQDLNWLTILPYTDEEGIVLFWLNLNRWNPDERSYEEMMQTAFAVCDIISMNPTCQINGVIAIWNLEGLSWRHVSEVFWGDRKWATIYLLQSGYPWRIKKIIMLNTNRLVRLAYNFLRPLMKRKIAERCILLGSDLTELHQYVDPLLLPEALKGALEAEECRVSPHILNNLPYLRYERSFISE